MKLVVTEKNDAAQKIADLLGATKPKADKVYSTPVYRCEAKTRKEIAAELYLSEGTVKRHISEILAKTGYDSILRLAVHAVSQGLIVPKMDK